MALPVSMKLIMNYFYLDLLETNKALLQPKASNDCLEAEKEVKKFEEKEINKVMHEQDNASEEDSEDNQGVEKDSHIFQPLTNLFHYLPLEESMHQFAKETSYEQSKV